MQTDLRDLVEQKAREFIAMDPGAKEFNRDVFDARERQVNVGHKLVREANVQERSRADQALRAIRMIAQTPELREQYVRASQPKLLPQIKGRP